MKGDSPGLSDSGTSQHRVLDRSDVIVGFLSVIAGGVVIVYTRTMPALPGGAGPGLFPTMIGSFAILFGVILTLKAVVKASIGRGTDARVTEELALPHSDTDDFDSVTNDELRNVPRQNARAEVGASGMVTSLRSRWLNALGVVAAIAFYVVAAETLGFLMTLFVILVGLMLMLRSKILVAVFTAAGVTALLYGMFELGLLVQLPSGFWG